MTKTRVPHEDQGMTTTKTKTRKAEPGAPPTFADIARRKMADRITTYRQLVKRQADGETLDEADLNSVTETLEALGLPDYSWSLHVEAVKRHAVATEKLKAVEAAAPANRQRSMELGKEIDALQAKLRTMLEERRKAESAVSKPGTYGHTVAQLEAEHALVLADMDTAVSLRLEELNKRRAAS